MDELKKVQELIAGREREMAEDLMAISRIPAINPRMDGKGEYQRMQWIISKLAELEIPFKVIEVPDQAVAEGVRLNVVASWPGTEDTGKTLWFISHVDTVHSGDTANWRTDPYQPQEIDGKIYGLGVEDNTQAVITSLQVAKIMKEQGIRAKCNIGFIFASDEETGSKYGLHALLDDEEQKVFSPRDEAIVPDSGSADGSFIEIAEKSQVWLRFTVHGKQAHAAMPDLGINACSIGMHMGVEIDDSLKKEFALRDELYNPPYSSFELTQKFANVNSPNVLPGLDVFTMDMRILPQYAVDDVVALIKKIVAKYEQAHPGISVELEFVTRVDAPPPTPSDAPVVQNLLASLKEAGVDNACYGGIGGGTCGAILRKHHMPAVIWSTLDELAHQPNEYVVIKNLVKDTQIFIATVWKYC